MLRGDGFLGTGATFGADLTLIVQVLFFLGLSAGVIAQLLRKHKVHDWIQTPIVILNFFFIIFVMVASFLEQEVATTLPRRPTDPFFLTPVFHALVGIVAQGLATYALLAGHQILPRKIGRLRYVMWTTYVFWILAVGFGITTYAVWYLLDSGGEVVSIADVDFATVEEGEPAVQRALLQNFAFQPGDLTVVEGTTVVWVNQDSAPHNVTFADNSSGSDNFFQGEAFELTFDRPGVISLYCTLHGNPTSGMIGTVTVLEDTAENAAQVAAVQAEVEAVIVPPAPTPAPEVPLAPVALIEPPEPGQAVLGLMAFRDNVAPGDSVTVAMTGVEPAPDGGALHAWLTSSGEILDLGQVAPDDQGELSFTYIDPGRQNLMAVYSGLQISIEPAGDTDPRPGQIAYSGQAGSEAFSHIRHIVATAADTPGDTGYGIGGRSQAEEIIRHAQFLQLAADLLSLADAQRHAEHVINVLEGENGQFFDDWDGAHGLQNPGDGFGLIPYVEAVMAAAEAAATATDTTGAVGAHAGHVGIISTNVLATAEALREAALAIVEADDIGQVTGQVDDISQLSLRLLLGEDTDGDGSVSLAESGIFQAYQHAQYMGAVGLVAGDSAAVVDATPAGGDETQLVGGEIVIDMLDFTYSLETVSIPAGSRVRFVNSGAARHSATADDGTFDTGLLDPGAEMVVSFDEPGFYPYYCLLHGTPGGVGMAAAITVVDAGAEESDASPAEPAPASAEPAETPAASEPPASEPPAPEPPPTEPPHAAEFQLDMLDFTYSDLNLEAQAGSTVIWANVGAFQHSATADDGSWDTTLLDPGGAASVDFDTPGTYPYYCILHGGPGGAGMSGTITITGG